MNINAHKNANVTLSDSCMQQHIQTRLILLRENTNFSLASILQWQRETRMPATTQQYEIMSIFIE